MTFPVDKFSYVNITPVYDTRIQTPRYFRNRARGNRTPYYNIELTTPLLDYDEHLAATGALEAYESQLEIFTIANPLPVTGPQFPDYNLEVAAPEGQKFIVVDRVVNYQLGQYIRCSNHAKVYRISSMSDDGSNTTINLNQPLIQNVTAASRVIYGANVDFQVSLQDVTETEVTADNGKFQQISVDLIEQA